MIHRPLPCPLSSGECVQLVPLQSSSCAPCDNYAALLFWGPVVSREAKQSASKSDTTPRPPTACHTLLQAASHTHILACPLCPLLHSFLLSFACLEIAYFSFPSTAGLASSSSLASQTARDTGLELAHTAEQELVLCFPRRLVVTPQSRPQAGLACPAVSSLLFELRDVLPASF